MSFNNPLKFDFIEDMLVAILNAVIVIAIPFVVFYLIYAGFLYVTARGNAEQIQQASRALLYGAIGGIVIVSSFTILTIMKNIVASFAS